MLFSSSSNSFLVDLPQGSSDSFPLAVEWHFGGTYSGVDIPVVECGGLIELTR